MFSDQLIIIFLCKYVQVYVSEYIIYMDMCLVLGVYLFK